MKKTHWSDELDLLRAKGIALAPGLTSPETNEIEETFGFTFPPDLRSFLAEAVPISDRFPNWRSRAREHLVRSLAWPFDGIRFDIENSEFWWPTWGPKPGDLAAAIEVARERTLEAPTLVPVYGHRYMPCEPPELGNPVLSVYQTDIIYYGLDLARYLACEFGELSWEQAVDGDPKWIRFWTDLVEANSGETG